MADFEIINPLIGGAMIGLAASGMLWANGRVMGVSGIIGGLLNFSTQDTFWRFLFIVGILIGSLFIPSLGFSIAELPFDRGIESALFGGLLVGLGTSLGNGCTSGHGVCGISRLSRRSLLATIIFIAMGVLTVTLYNALGPGN